MSIVDTLVSDWWLESAPARTTVHTLLALDEDVAVVPCDATDRESVKAVLLALLYSVVDSLETPASETAAASV